VERAAPVRARPSLLARRLDPRAPRARELDAGRLDRLLEHLIAHLVRDGALGRTPEAVRVRPPEVQDAVERTAPPDAVLRRRRVRRWTRPRPRHDLVLVRFRDHAFGRGHLFAGEPGEFPLPL